MAKNFARAFYNSKQWHACRDAYISKRLLIDGGLCEICHAEQGYILHHKTRLTAANIVHPEIALNPKNLQFVCKKCHDEEHFEDINGQKRKKINCFFDADGQPIPPVL